MKKFLYVSFLAWILSTGIQAEEKKPVTEESNSTTLSVKETKEVNVVTRRDIKILEATENIRLLTQQIAKEYLFLFKTPQQALIKNKLNKLLVKLSNDLRVISETTKDKDSKDILEFLAYSKDQISQTLTEKLDNEQAALMLDYSETLLEGADSIAAAHTYDFSKEERMLMRAKQTEYLIERIMKYYMALHVGFDNPTNRDQMTEAIADLKENLEKIDAYVYPEKIALVKDETVKGWSVIENTLAKSKTLFIPKLMLISTAYLEEKIEVIALHHSQNQ